MIAHHSYTNIKGLDADIQAFDGPSALYGHRSSPFTLYRLDYRRWLRSLFVTMPFSCVQPSLKQDYNVWWRDTYDGVSMVRVAVAPWRRVAHFALHWSAFAAVIVLPFALFWWAKALCFALVPPALYGGIYYVFSQISHVNEDCFVSSELGGEWAVWQIRHSLDWCVTERERRARPCLCSLMFRMAGASSTGSGACCRWRSICRRSTICFRK